MRKVLFGLGVMLSLGLFSACSSDEGNELFKVRNFANSGCKSATRVGDEGGTLYDENETIEVKGLKDGYLSINHKNALFNCEAGGFNIIATIDGNVIEYPRQVRTHRRHRLRSLRDGLQLHVKKRRKHLNIKMFRKLQALPKHITIT